MKVLIEEKVKKEVDLVFYEFKSEGESEIVAAIDFLSAITYLADMPGMSIEDYIQPMMQIRQIPEDEILKVKVKDLDNGDRKILGKTIIREELKNGFNGPFLFSTTDW